MIFRNEVHTTYSVLHSLYGPHARKGILYLRTSYCAGLAPRGPAGGGGRARCEENRCDATEFLGICIDGIYGRVCIGQGTVSNSGGGDGDICSISSILSVVFCSFETVV